MRLGPNGQFEYNAQYRVLICRKYRWAIPKNSVRYHSLRHGLSLQERRQLLPAIDQLDLLAPEDIVFPTPDSPPIDSLPVVAGRCCTAEAGCGYLTTSHNQMRQHHREAHGLTGPPRLYPSFSRPASLQNFFRPKVKYFEVTPLATVSSTASRPAFDGEPWDISDANDAGDTSDSSDSSDISPTPSPSADILPSIETPAMAVDLETLTYFHHYTTKTSLTLPLPGHEDSVSAKHYWKVVVVTPALKCQWLMRGLLALSAGHLATLATDRHERETHISRAEALFAEFACGVGNSRNLDLDILSFLKSTQNTLAAAQVGAVFASARWVRSGLLTTEATNPATADTSPVVGIMESLQSLCHPTIPFDTTLRPVWAWNFLDQLLRRKRGGLHRRRRISGVCPVDLVQDLRTRFYSHDVDARASNPETASRVSTITSALHDLIAHCNKAMATDDGSLTCQIMTAWLVVQPAEFKDMVELRDTDALEVVAYWAATLVNWAGQCN
ncbi:uncharacterized protein N7459_000545 [Penicillium hispanicum]|uniref:uncharacterized protein n=1 Tax=Penicillium hispanicum TaxID=1080232 RepID=UPI0025409452|nr:uncharacterized protein N7459_000545 [Penicillium hispanicum]KAJ5594337.1 hypothetical protein N7459_000545 [Penicillium hispanicum]